MTLNSKHKFKNNTYGNTKNQNTEKQKPGFIKQQVENTDLHKPVLNKIMTTRESRTKYNFVAPLILVFTLAKQLLR